MPKVITGQWSYPDGSPVNGILYLQLSQSATAVGTAQVAPRNLAVQLVNGVIPPNYSIYANDEISPGNTYYTVTIVAGGGTVWGPENFGIAGASPINLNTLVALTTNFFTSAINIPSPTISTPNITGGFTLNGAAPVGHVPRGNGTFYVDAQLGYTDLSGLPQLPVNKPPVAHNFITAYNSVTGAFTQAQPADADISFTDITTGNVSTSAHGFTPKAPNDSTKFLNGVGTYTIPPGTFAISGGGAVSHEWVSAITSAGACTLSQPAASDLSDGVTGSGAVVLATSPTLGGTVQIVTSSASMLACIGSNSAPRITIETTAVTTAATNVGFNLANGNGVLWAIASYDALSGTNVDFSFFNNQAGAGSGSCLTISGDTGVLYVAHGLAAPSLITASGALVLGAVGVDYWHIVNASGSLIATTDNSYDIGYTSSSYRPRSIFAGTSVVAPLVNATTGFQVNGGASSGNVLRGNGTDFVSAKLALSDLSGALTGVTGSIGGSPLTLGQQATGTASITGASAAVAAGAVIVVTPVTQGDPGDGFIWTGNLTGSDTVTVKVICLVAGTPTATTYNVAVLTA